MNRWFDLMSSRQFNMAFSLHNIETYNQSIQFLNFCIELFDQIVIGDKKWKPVQAGLILSTKSMLSLQHDLLHRHAVSFFLSSRVTQDCLENLFSCVRQKNPKPTPSQFKQNLRIITISQFSQYSPNQNYDDDEVDHLLNLNDVPSTPSTQEETDCMEIL